MDKDNKLPLIYVIAIPLIFMIANSITFWHFNILGSPLYISVMLYPLIYLFSGLVIKKTDYKNALRLMLLGLMVQTLESVVIWIMINLTNPGVIIYAFISFLICQLIFIYVYDFLRKIKKDSYIPVFLLMLVIETIDHAFFGPIIEGQIISMSILVRVIYTVFIPVLLARQTKK